MKRMNPTQIALLAILGLSFGLKVLLVLLHGAMYDLNSDDRSYLVTAQHWLQTGVFTYNDPERPTVFITPAFPALLAGLMKILGPGFLLEQVVRVLQAGMVTVGLFLLYLIGKRLFSERVAIWAAGLSAFYPPLWLASNLILTESMFVLSVMLLVYVTLRAMETPTSRWMVIFGVTWAFAVYVRPTIALWPGILFLLLLAWRHLPWQQLLKQGVIVGLAFSVCLSPWWVRNYHVSDGEFIPLTRSGGNPLLLGTFPYGLPSLEEQRTWHATNNLWENDAFDTQWAKQRIKAGFETSFGTYLRWYTVGKFKMFWGDVFYWLPVANVPKGLVVLYHYLIVILGFIGVWFARWNRGAMAVFAMLAYMTVLHMIYLAHGRYSAPLIPFMALFAVVGAIHLASMAKGFFSRAEASPLP
jgi:4-amino-4-deoxy-L-arabinose transferase-like glycosyltransferase